jgi:hypothetical protein
MLITLYGLAAIAISVVTLVLGAIVEGRRSGDDCREGSNSFHFGDGM